MGTYANFYNSINHDRVYDASSMEEWLKPFFTNGVFNGEMQVIANNDMTVTVSTGNAFINGKLKKFDSTQTVTIGQSNSSLARIDNIVVRRDDASRDFIIDVVQGSYSASPVAPIPNRTGNIYEIVLAQVKVNAAAIKVTQADITDTRMSSSVCGWVAATVKEITFDQIVLQWENYLDQRKDVDLAEFEQWREDTEAMMRAYEDQSQEDFGDWFEHIKGQLTTDAAGHLQDQIDALKYIYVTEEILHVPSTFNTVSDETLNIGNI